MIDYHIWALMQPAAQQVQSAMPSPTAPMTAFHDPVSTKLTTSAVIVYVLEVAKRSNLLPWITAHTKYMNRFASVVAACASAVGIHFTFDHISGTLMITGLSLATVLSALWAVLQQYCLQ